jgi:hypothetical protein
MRKIAPAAMLVLVLILSGCESRRVAREANQLSAAYEYQMDKGRTTSEQDKQFIHAISKVNLQLDSAIRNTKSAQQSRDDAIKAAEGSLQFDK